MILISVYKQPTGFPTDTSRAYKYYIFPATSPELHVIFSDYTPGVYAIALVHDENSNGRLDTNIFEMPVEGFATQGKNQRFSAPRFSNTAIKIGPHTNNLTIRMNYLSLF